MNQLATIEGYYVHTCMYFHTIDEEKGHNIGDVHRKRVANAFWTYQIQQEIKEQNNYGFTFKGPKAQEMFMTEVDIQRANSVYPHVKCGKDCKRRGNYMYIELYVCVHYIRT